MTVTQPEPDQEGADDNVVRCPDCGMRYHVNFGRIPLLGKKVKCRRCLHMFPVLKQDDWYRDNLPVSMAAYVIYRKHRMRTHNLKYDMDRIQSFKTWLAEYHRQRPETGRGLRAVTVQDVHTYLEELDRSEGDYPHHGMVATLTEFFGILYNEGLVDVNVMEQLRSDMDDVLEDLGPFSHEVELYIKHRRTMNDVASLPFDLVRIKEMEVFLAERERSLITADDDDLEEFFVHISRRFSTEKLDGFRSTVEGLCDVLSSMEVVDVTHLCMADELEWQEIEEHGPDAKDVKRSRVKREKQRLKVNNVVFVVGMVAICFIIWAATWFLDINKRVQSEKAVGKPEVVVVPTPDALPERVEEKAPEPVDEQQIRIQELEAALAAARDQQEEAEQRLKKLTREQAAVIDSQRKKLQMLRERADAAAVRKSLEIEQALQADVEEQVSAAREKQNAEIVPPVRVVPGQMQTTVELSVETESGTVKSPDESVVPSSAGQPTLSEQQSDSSSVKHGVSLPVIPHGSQSDEHTQKADVQRDPNCLQGDCFQGRGSYLYPNGDRYVGMFRDGERHGDGIMYYDNGDRWVGQFVNGRRSGRGVKHLALNEALSNQKLESALEFEQKAEELAQEKIRQHREEEDRTMRSALNEKRAAGELGCVWGECTDGEGVFFYPNGDEYMGDFFGGERQGNGAYLYNTGEKYVGEWHTGRKHGKGVVYFPDGVVMEGRWLADEQVMKYVGPQ
ncbi:MAG: hypothetical protein HQL50_02785 [Magnetococcales bacterium]|nr:hypothetical protein [Magnetococcales bacterium]